VDNAEHVTKAVQKIFSGTLPIDRTTTALSLAFDRPPFKCPELEINIRQPCSVQSCAFWTPREWTRNCIIYYMVDQNRDSLDLKELTILLGEETQTVRKRWNAAVAASSHTAMILKTDQIHREDATATLAEPSANDVCSACGEANGDNTIARGGFVYCCRECCEARPPLELRLESEFKLPVQRILEICRTNFYARRPMRHALNVSNRQLEDLCTSHEIDISAIP
jgi:hypothetical protein